MPVMSGASPAEDDFDIGPFVASLGTSSFVIDDTEFLFTDTTSLIDSPDRPNTVAEPRYNE